jgi:hypothetical protein
VAEAVWASYSVGAGYVSGRAASNSFFALALGLGISLLVAGIGTTAQWVSRARERRQGGAVRPSAVVVASVAGDGPAAPVGPAEPPLKGAGPTVGPWTVGPPAGPRDGPRDGCDGTVRCSSAGRGR